MIQDHQAASARGAEPAPPYGAGADRESALRERLADVTDRAGVASRKNDRLANALRAARTELSALHQEIERLTAPPRSYGVFLGADRSARLVDVLLGGRRMELGVAANVPVGSLYPGMRVKVNEHLVVIATGGYEDTGQIVLVKELIDTDRALVTVREDEEHIMRLAGSLDRLKLHVGDALVADTRAGVAYERIVRAEVEELLLDEVPDVDYTDIGGLGPQIEHIRDSVEMPFLHPQLYRDHELKPPKGILLYGPPGCGKTLIAKAVANSLARTAAERSGQVSARSYFLNIRGPQLLNKYVGETERQIRLIFARAREKAERGIPVIVFFDEMDALFRTRGTGKSSDVETTVVPQFLAEMDGVEALDNVVIIGASNREDMIDPAILRPGRLDVKVRIERPTALGALEILGKYLTDTLPLAADEVHAAGGAEPAAQLMRQAVVEALYTDSAQTAFLHVRYAGGDTETLFISHFVSGAMLANIVDRAKKLAIKDLLATGTGGISTAHLRAAVAAEIAENEDLPSTTDPDEWARASGRKGERVVSLRVLRSVQEALQVDPSLADLPGPVVTRS
ncbi:MAG: proteasome ATPase [Micrococcales bacterium]|nr:proteasome ATPase [Micrococcales bacterium]